MRKLIIVFLAVSLFAACNNKKGPADEKKPDTKEEKTEVKDDDKDKPEDRTTSSSDWTSVDVSAFVDNCTDEAVRKGMQQQKASDYCNCMQKKLEDMYPKKAEIANLDIESPTVKSMIEKCLE